MVKHPIRSIGLGCGLLMACVTQVHATSVDLTLASNINQAVNPGLSDINVNFQGTTTNNANVGEINWTVSNPLDSGYKNGASVSTFCIQGLQDVFTGGTYNYQIVALNTTGLPEGGSDQGVLDSTAALQIQGFGNSFFADVGSTLPGYTANEVGAAFQLGVWEIEYDGGIGGEAFPQAANYNYFAQGQFQANATSGSDGAKAITLANSWLNSFSPATGVTSLALVSTGAQDQMIFQPGGGSTPPVPVPPALPAGLSLLGGLFVVRKIRQARVS